MTIKADTTGGEKSKRIHVQVQNESTKRIDADHDESGCRGRMLRRDLGAFGLRKALNHKGLRAGCGLKELKIHQISIPTRLQGSIFNGNLPMDKECYYICE